MNVMRIACGRGLLVLNVLMVAAMVQPAPVLARAPMILTGVGDVPRVGFMVGSTPPTAADAAIVDHLAARGLVVDIYDDEPANRPDAATIAAASDVVLLSSTVLSANVAA